MHLFTCSVFPEVVLVMRVSVEGSRDTEGAGLKVLCVCVCVCVSPALHFTSSSSAAEDHLESSCDRSSPSLFCITDSVNGTLRGRALDAARARMFAESAGFDFSFL